MAKSPGQRKSKQKSGKKQNAGRSQGGLKLHGDKLAHAVREAAEKPAKRGRP
jgi:hypothetical protein